MTTQLNRIRFFRRAALIGMVALGGLIGCGEGMSDSPESLAFALTAAAGPYGSTTGTAEAPSSVHTTAVTKIVGYGSMSYVYGIRLYWGTSSFMFGQTNGASAQVFELDGEPITKVEYNGSGGVLRGIKFTNSLASLSVGNVPSTLPAFANPDAELRDMKTWKGEVNGVPVLWGATFHYATP